MRRDGLERLIVQGREIEEFFGLPSRGVVRRSLWRVLEPWAGAMLAAAAIFLALAIPANAPSPASANGLQLDAAVVHRAEAAVLESCSNEDLYALVLMREWMPDCECIGWRLYRPSADLPAVMRLLAGQTASVPVDEAHDPSVLEYVVLAVSRSRSALPHQAEDEDELIRCLWESAPPATPFESSQSYASAVAACLPAAVTVVPESLRRR